MCQVIRIGRDSVEGAARSSRILQFLRDISGQTLRVLPKDGGAFQHHAYGDLSREWELFQAYLGAYRLEKAKPTKEAKPKAVEKPAKPRIRVKARSIPSLSMAEMLRACGHVPEVRA
jgi:hypothetical protein